MHGENRKDVVTDARLLTNPHPLVAWRPKQEQRATHSTILNGVVVRPALLYGRPGSLSAPLFKSAHGGKVARYGRPGGR